MKKIMIVTSILVFIIMMFGCKKNPPSSPSGNSTPSGATQTAIALLTAGPSAQATATAQAQLTADEHTTETAIATLWTATATATITPTNTPIAIYANFEGDDQAGGIYSYAYIYVRDANGNAIINAGVIIKNITNATRTNVPYNGNYYYIQNLSYIPGNTYEVDVCVNGVTYTAQSVAPGPAQLDPGGSIVSWPSSVSDDHIYVYNPDGTLAFSQSDSGNNNNNKTVDISSVYPSSGQFGEYSVSAELDEYYYNYQGAFAGASQNSYIDTKYNVSWDVFVTSGSTVAGTPTPTNTPSVIIHAYIEGDDQADGMSAYEYVDVNDANNNAITGAVVTIKDITNASQANAVYNGGDYRVQNPQYVPGDNYEVDVCIGNITYTAQVAAPGPAQIDPEGNTVSWQNGGSNNYIYVYNPDNTEAFYQSNGGSANKNGVLDLSAVYDESGQYGEYRININLDSYHNAFTGTSPNSEIYAVYNVSWDVYVTPGSSAVGTPTPTNTPAAIIYARINGGQSNYSNINVNDGSGSAITDAGVTIKNITEATQASVPYSGSNYNIQNFPYISGDNYEVDVCVNGVTYTAQAVAPGPAQIDPAGNTVSWQNGGNDDFVSIENPDNTQAFYRSYGGNANNNSTIDISSVYPASGQYGEYYVNVNLENFIGNNNGAFAGTSQNSYFYMQYNVSWEVFVTAGSQVVGTPTPTP
jgi:hypothetical protein